MSKNVIESQRIFFHSQTTKDINFRINSLKKLRNVIITHEDAICNAIYKDFKKPKFETLVTETQFVLSELNFILKNVKTWYKPTPVSSTLANFPSSDWIYSEPYGNILIISPWNYPFQLALAPLIGAIAAGNTVTLKPSELTPYTSGIISKIIGEVFPKEYVTVVEGGVETSQELLKEKWDYIFFTGSTRVGKIIYKSAAENLTPVTLELGGKNPCIVDESASIKLAAKQIAWGKFLNAGQTCIAPDYILAHKSIKEELIKELKVAITKFYGTKIQESKDLARIATNNHYERLKNMLINQTILFGGNFDDENLFLEPTLLDNPKIDSIVMKSEIFGPILPIISYENEDDLRKYISLYDKPLALYIFSKKKKNQDKILKTYSFGNGAINDIIIQIANKKLPFGGVGGAGIGNYHGKHSFDLFSHKKAIVKKATWLDIPLRYAPYKIPLKWVKKVKYLY